MSEERLYEIKPEVHGPFLLACPGKEKWLLLGDRWKIFLLDASLNMTNVTFNPLSFPEMAYLAFTIPEFCDFNGSHWLVSMWFQEDVGPSFSWI